MEYLIFGLYDVLEKITWKERYIRQERRYARNVIEELDIVEADIVVDQSVENVEENVSLFHETNVRI